MKTIECPRMSAPSDDTSSAIPRKTAAVRDGTLKTSSVLRHDEFEWRELTHRVVEQADPLRMEN